MSKFFDKLHVYNVLLILHVRGLSWKLIDKTHMDAYSSNYKKLFFSFWEKKEEIWLNPVTKTPTPTEQSKKQRDNIKTPPKTLITQLLRTDYIL